MTKVVILAGGKGTRLKEKTQEIPKPLLMVGDRPIIQHIIDSYVLAGYDDFIVPVGYMAHKLLTYFMSKAPEIPYIESEEFWDYTIYHKNIRIQLVGTGLETQTGGRLHRLWMQGKLQEPFLMTYGDGISDVNNFGVEMLGKGFNVNVVTAVHPIPRFGSMVISPDGAVISFGEKVINPHDWINGGFMYLKPDIFKYKMDDNTNFEKDILPDLSANDELVAFKHTGLWHCVDTLRDLELANELYDQDKLPWVRKE